MLGPLNSAIAMSAALTIAWPAAPGLPGADIGRISPTWTSRCGASGAAPAGAAGAEDMGQWVRPRQNRSESARTSGQQARRRQPAGRASERRARRHRRGPLNLQLPDTAVLLTAH